MKAALILFLFFVTEHSAQTADSLTFSEIMFYQPQSNCEFIEIANYSETQAIDIRGLKIKYETSATDSTQIVSGDSVLPPGGFAVILEGDYDFENPFYALPESSAVLKILDNNFGSAGMSNASDKTLRLISANGDTLSVYRYSADNRKGYSDEKIIISNDNATDNWANSLAENGTPAARNSVTPYDYDLKIKSVAVAENFITVADSFSLTLVAENAGLLASDFAAAEFYVDFNRDSAFDASEFCSALTLPQLNPGDTLALRTALAITDTGNFAVLTRINFRYDENSANDSAIVTVKILPRLASFGEICFNEIKYLPIGGEPEWLEIYNNSDSVSFNLENWRVADRVSSKKITEDVFDIMPHEYVILTSDDALLDFYPISARIIYADLPSLNNAGDKIKLLDNYGNCVDSVEYSANWNDSQPHASLEKIEPVFPGNDSLSWRGSQNALGGTPGAINSVSPKNFDVAVLTAFSSPNPAEINSEINVAFRASNKGRFAADFSATLFYDADEDSLAETRISELDAELSSGDSAVFVFPAQILLDSEKLFAVKIVFEEDMDTSNNFAEIRVFPSYPPNSLIINEILFEPQNGECEWLEAVNNNSFTINLKNWTISDLLAAPTRKTISTENLFVPPGEKIVIANDSSLLDYHAEIPSALLTLDLPGFNNSEDAIVLRDANNKTVDSLHYYGRWLSVNKRSLERILRATATCDSANWAASVDAEFSTPGRKNSVSPLQNDLALLSLEIDSASVTSEFIPVHFLLCNSGLNESPETQLAFYDDGNLDSLTSENEFIGAVFLPSLTFSDSLAAEFDIPNPKIKTNLIAKIIFDDDENAKNNVAYLPVLPDYPAGAVKINEIHYAPINGEPEWVEFQNCSRDTVNLENFIFSDMFSEPRPARIEDSLFLVAPAQKFVLAKDSAVLAYHAEIPSPLVVKKFANLNNDKEGAIIRNAYGKVLDSLCFNANWGGENGRSLERISLLRPSADSTNWASSNDDELSTPGRKNSVSPKIHNLSVDTLFFSPVFPRDGEKIDVFATVTDRGSETENDVKILFSENGIPSDSATVTQIASGETKTVRFECLTEWRDSITVSVTALLAADEDTRDNSRSLTIYSGLNRGDLLLSEIMVTPDSSGEWIEIFNATNSPVSLAMFKLADSAGIATAETIGCEHSFINPGSYYVFYADSVKFRKNYGDIANGTQANFGSLNNTRDLIYLYDFRGNAVDSLLYENWDFKRGFSFEKIDLFAENVPRNWARSVDSLKATPGKANSVANLPEYEPKSVIINEIMFEPSSDNCEFFEIYNPTNESVQIGGWKFRDERSNEKPICETKYFLRPDNYFLVSADSSAIKYYNLRKENVYVVGSDFALGNDEDEIVLLDFRGTVIDSVRYFSDWHNENFANTNNRSLERISPANESNNPYNWSSSLAKQKATPCARNSVFQNSGGETNGLTIFPNPFSPDNDGFEDVTFIKYKLDANINLIRARIYDSKGRLVRTLADDFPTGASGEIIFDGRDENGTPLPLGIYILFFERISDGKTVKKSVKPLVIARKLN